MSTGPLALIGGRSWDERCSFDEELLAESGGEEVVLLPTGAAYENPGKVVDLVTGCLRGVGASVRPLMVLKRGDAEDSEAAAAVKEARFVYVVGPSPLHLRSVLKESKVWQALSEAWHAGAVVAGSSAGASVLCDPMVDPRGGAFTLGLGLVEQLAIIPHYDTWSQEKAHRTFRLAPAGLPVAGIEEHTALIREPDGSWRAAGPGRVEVHVDGHLADLDALPR